MTEFVRNAKKEVEHRTLQTIHIPDSVTNVDSLKGSADKLVVSSQNGCFYFFEQSNDEENNNVDMNKKSKKRERESVKPSKYTEVCLWFFPFSSFPKHYQPSPSLLTETTSQGCVGELR